MQPNRRFHWGDKDALLTFVAEVSFAHLFAMTPDGPRVAHAPLVVTRAGNLRFHLARANALTAHLDGAAMVASIAGPEAYISPDWYGSADQVPTWNYQTVEAEGRVARLSDDDLVALLDDLSAAHEARLLPKKPWTRAKMTPGRFEAMLPAIVGFELTVETLRGTDKMGQNKTAAEMLGAVAGLEESGQTVVADLMRRHAEAKA
ncbi:FMN-binding negative transcriptional regulator [Sphingoaurantiacus capsulatus]|uniref:FMN-binding negative transcriptional regulator n=1 Tax=Sphingoaurantiacus capsulatus TaxID=1771310 RepID=A0ABV7XAD0_9SPHN